METLLNLAWLLLVLPAYYLWRGSRVSKGQKFGSLQALLALACALVILFPVISATDDLHVMRAEIEESSCNKRSVRASSNDKISAWTLRWQASPVLVESLRMFAPGDERGQVTLVQSPPAPMEPSMQHVGRAPPTRFV